MWFYLILFLGADLANLVNAAAIYAATEGDQSVTTRHLEFARDKILMGEYFSFFWLYKTLYNIVLKLTCLLYVD